MVDTILEWLALGGPVVAILIAMSIFSLTIILLKLWQFQANRIGSRRPIRHAFANLQHGHVDQALSALSNHRNPIAQTMHTALSGRLSPDHEEDRLREEVTRQAVGHVENLRGHLRGLEAVGALAPLLGLLGTVLGMIEAFRQMEAAGSQVNPALLSGGIWEALLTTAVGLIVAIPAVAAHSWLERRVQRFQHHLEDAVTRVFTMPVASKPARLQPELVAKQANAY